LNGALSKILFDWFRENQNPKNGLWDQDSDYYATDGMFKIVTVYNSFGVAMDYALEAAMATIDSIMSDEQVGTVCNMYNAWHNVGLIKTNLRSYSKDKKLAEEQIETIQKAIISRAPEALRITLDKTKNFLIEDGSFSYLIGHSSETSQGMPTAVLNSYEGDVNATLICIGGLIGNINAALNLPKVNPYGLKDWYVFMDIIENNGSSVKDKTMADVALTYEDDAVEDKAEHVETGILSDGYILVAEDPKKPTNKVLEVYHPYAPGKGDYLRFTNYNHWLNRPCTVFESDFYINSERTDSTYVAQILLGSAYYVTLRLDDGKVGIWEDSSTELIKTRQRHLADAELDKWFNLRVEYYNGNHESVRIKVFLDGELIAVSANYANSSGNKLKDGKGTPAKGFEKVSIFPLSYVNLNMYLDNTLVTSTNDPYVSEADAVGLAVNEDIEPRDREAYGFDGDALDGDITLSSGSATVKDGTLQLSSGTAAALKIPVNIRTPLPNCYSFGFDIDFTNAKDGDALTFAFTEPYGYEGKTVNITSLSLKCVTEGGEKYLVVTSKAGAVTYSNTKIAVSDEPCSLEFLHFSTEMQTLIYKDGEFMGLTNYVTVDFPARFELGYITLTHTGKADITLDNVFVEARKESFEKETKPPVDRIIYDFEDGVGEGVTTDGAISDGALVLDGKEITFPVNKRVETVFSTELALDVTLTEGEGKYTRVSFTDRDGNIIFSLDMSYVDGTLSLFEVTPSGRHAAVAEYPTEPEATLTFTHFPDNGIVTAEVGDECILATSILYSESFGEAAYAVIFSDGIALDNVTLEGLVFNYSAPTVKVENSDDADSVLTYEGSSTGNLPENVSATLVTAGAEAAVRLMMKDTLESKVLAFTTSNGNCDYVDFVIKGGERSRRIIFETDIYFAINGYYEINVLNSTNGSKNAYRPILSGRGGWVYYYDVATNGGANPGKEVKIAKMGEWVTFTLEVDLGYGDVESPRMITRINGEVVYDSRNYIGSLTGAPALPDLNRVRFYTHTPSTGMLYFDNTSIVAASCIHSSLSDWSTVTEADCENSGLATRSCNSAECDYVEERIIEPLGHDLGDWEAIEDTEYSDQRRDCSRCDYYETRPDPDLNYSPTGSVLQVKDGASSIVVLIHDDGYISSMTVADAILKKYGLVADVALMTDMVWDSTSGAVKDTRYKAFKTFLYNGRWGLINHTATHTYWGTDENGTLTVDSNKLYSEVVASGEVLRNIFPGHRVLTFAYPGISALTSIYGEEAVYKEIRELAAANYVAARFYSGGVMSLDGITWDKAGATPIGNGSVTSVIDSFSDAASSPKLLVYFTHGIGKDAPSSDITEENYDSVCSALAPYVKDGSICNAHYEEAMLYLREYEAASLTLSGSKEAITVTLTDTLDDSVYNLPLTVRINVPRSFEAVKAVQGDRTVYANARTLGGERIVELSVIPDGGDMTVTPIPSSEVPPTEAPSLPEMPPDPPKPELGDGLVVDSFTDLSDSKGLSFSGGLTDDNMISVEYLDDLHGSVLKIFKSTSAGGSGKVAAFLPLSTDIMADALSVTFDIYMDSEARQGYKDVTYQIYFAGITNSPYYSIIQQTDGGFCFRDINSPDGNYGSPIWGNRLPALSYDEWHTVTIKINMFSKDAFLVTYYADGEVLGSSVGYGNYYQKADANISNYVRGVYFQTWSAAKTLTYIDNISVKAGSLEAMGIDTDRTYHFEESLGDISVSDGKVLTTSLTKLGDNLTNCLKLVKSKGATSTATFYSSLKESPVTPEAFSLSLDLRIGSSVSESESDTPIRIYFNSKDEESPYYLTITKTDGGFVIGDVSSPIGGASAAAISGTLDYDRWYNVRITVSNKAIDEFKAYLFIDGSLVGSSRNYSNYHGVDSPEHITELDCVRISAAAEASFDMYIDNVMLEYGDCSDIVDPAKILGIDLNFFPGFTRKAVTFTLDDGNVTMDKRVLDILRPAGILGTFNLIGTSSLSAEEYRELYSGYEIASHHALHSLPWRDGLDLSGLPYIENWPGSSAADPTYIYGSEREGYFYIDYHYYSGSASYSSASWHTIVTDELYAEYIGITDEELEKVFGEGSVVGFAYPHGQYNEAIRNYLKNYGYLYARKTGILAGTTGFALPEDRFAWTYNADHTNLISVMESFENLRDDGELKMFSFGVHAIDFNTPSLLDDLYAFAAVYGNRPDDFYYATNRDIFLYEDAIKAAEVTEERIVNHSALTLYIEIMGERITLAPWATYILETGEAMDGEPEEAPEITPPSEYPQTPEKYLPGYTEPEDPSEGEGGGNTGGDNTGGDNTDGGDTDGEGSDDRYIDGGAWTPVGKGG